MHHRTYNASLRECLAPEEAQQIVQYKIMIGNNAFEHKMEYMQRHGQEALVAGCFQQWQNFSMEFVEVWTKGTTRSPGNAQQT